MKSDDFFKDKKILFFSVKLFNLEIEIKNKLEELGALVTYYDERPSNNNFVKGIIRLKRKVYQIKINQYYKKILQEIKTKKFDYLFVIKGEVIPVFFLEEFKKSHSDCLLIFYTWDSFSNNTHPIDTLKYYDKKYTFDNKDAQSYKLQFRPLFYLDIYQDIVLNRKVNNKYDLLFLGTAHSDRYIIGNQIFNWCIQNNLNMYCYYYMPGRLVYFYKKLFDKTFKKFDYKNLSFKSLDAKKVSSLYKNSNVILDINHPGQNGLTMRTFESIGLKKKLITTNSEIKNYSFYNSNNIFIVDRNNVKLDLDFFKTEYQDIDIKQYKSLSIGGWLEELFNDQVLNNWISEIK
jgi:hypothetical protein